MARDRPAPGPVFTFTSVSLWSRPLNTMKVFALLCGTVAGGLGLGFAVGLKPSERADQDAEVALSEAQLGQQSPAPLRLEVPKATPELADQIHGPISPNYALASNGTVATGGTQPALLIDGNVTNYDGGNGYAATDLNQPGPPPFLIQFKQTYTLNVVRILLWNKDERFYRYKLEASPDDTSNTWVMLADKSVEGLQCRGWQTLNFKPQSVRRLRLTGTYNSANPQFHAVEVEAYFAPNGMPQRAEEMDF